MLHMTEAYEINVLMQRASLRDLHEKVVDLSSREGAFTHDLHRITLLCNFKMVPDRGNA